MKGIAPQCGTEEFFLDHSRGSTMDIVSDYEVLKNVDEAIEDVLSGLKAARGTCPSM